MIEDKITRTRINKVLFNIRNVISNIYDPPDSSALLTFGELASIFRIGSAWYWKKNISFLKFN